MSSQDIFDLYAWRLIKLTGWTADYVDSLSLGRMYKFIQIEDGLKKAEK